jgi:hypothetical protein
MLERDMDGVVREKWHRGESSESRWRMSRRPKIGA